MRPCKRAVRTSARTTFSAEIDETNAWVYTAVNNGVYKAGFATTQEAYERRGRRACSRRSTVSRGHLAEHRYLVGDRITEADWRLFTTLVRFDPVYVGHFKCNLRRLADYPNLWGYTRRALSGCPALPRP